MSPAFSSPQSRFLPVLLALFLTAALVTGCGGDEESETSPAAFVAEADAICAEYTDETALLESRFTEALDAGNLEDAASDFRDQAARVSEMLDRLAGLDLPVADRTTIEQLVEQGRQRVSAGEAAADAIAAGDGQTTVRLARKAITASDEYFRIADSLGFRTCGRAGSGPAQP